MSSFGEDLKRQREIRSLGLDEVAAATKIARHHLEALERADLESLPGPIFNRGFVRAYAEFVGLDPDQALAGYLAEEQAQGRGAPSEEELTREIARAVETRESSGIRLLPAPAAWWIAGLAVIGLSVVLGWFWLRDTPASGPDPVVREASPQEEAGAGGEPHADLAIPTSGSPDVEPAPDPRPRPPENATSPAAPDLPDGLEAPGSGQEDAQVPDRDDDRASAPPDRDKEPARTPNRAPSSTSETPDSPLPPPAVAVPDPPAGTAASSGPGAESSAKVSESGVGTDVVDRVLVGRGNRFVAGNRVWFWTRVLDGSAGEEVVHVWLHEGVPRDRVPFTIGGPHWRIYSRKTVTAAGRWAVEARDASGRVLAREEFLCAAAEND